MGRKPKQTVEYFPHFVCDSKTKRTLARYWKNDGYAFWFKLLELLGGSDGHIINLSTPAKWEDFLNYTLVDSETALAILNKLAELEKIDRDLWIIERIIWCQTFVDNLSFAYDKRTVSLPKKPDLSEYPGRKSEKSGISGDIRGGNPQMKWNEMKENDNLPLPLPREGVSDSESELTDGESLLVETATGGSEKDSHSMTRKARTRKNTGALTEEQRQRFERFWEAWPKKKSIAQAEKAFAKIDPDDDLLQEILAGVERAKELDHRFREEQYIPYPSTWLNSKGWTDVFTNTDDIEERHRAAAKWLADDIRKRLKGFKYPSKSELNEWAMSFYLLETKDGVSWDEIRKTIQFAAADEFWRGQALSGVAFREKYNSVRSSLERSGKKDGGAASVYDIPLLRETEAPEDVK